jgi:hypothetical protein
MIPVPAPMVFQRKVGRHDLRESYTPTSPDPSALGSPPASGDPGRVSWYTCAVGHGLETANQGPAHVGKVHSLHIQTCNPVA